jgi:hypothetical protein
MHAWKSFELPNQPAPQWVETRESYEFAAVLAEDEQFIAVFFVFDCHLDHRAIHQNLINTSVSQIFPSPYFILKNYCPATTIKLGSRSSTFFK